MLTPKEALNWPHVFRCLLESTHPKKRNFEIEFENASISINRQFMLEKTFELHPEVCKYPQSALKHRRKMNLSFLVHWSARVSQADLLEKK